MNFTYYIIPDNAHHVEHRRFLDWEKTDSINPNIPTVIVINDTLSLRYARFVVVYKGMMQTQGGGGCCYNPTKRTFHNADPMDNSLMPAHMSKWVTFDMSYLFKMVVAAKSELLKVLGIQIPYYYCLELYLQGMYGLLAGQMDLIGMGIANTSILVERKNWHTPKLLPQHID